MCKCTHLHMFTLKKGGVDKYEVGYEERNLCGACGARLTFRLKKYKYCVDAIAQTY